MRVTPLSAFASGDDLVAGEELQWFAPEDALRTAARLLETDEAAALPAGVRFCLLVREGSFAIGHEMSARKGSFF